MPTIKCTMLIQQNTGGGAGQLVRVGGWSESWYSQITGTELISRFNSLCQVRAAMLSPDARIIGQRYQQVEPEVTSSQVASVTFPGTSGTAGDVPQMSVLVKVVAQAPNPNIRQWAIRGVPDARVVNGEFVPSIQWTQSFNTFQSTLQGLAFRFRGRDLLASQGAINFIDATGEVWMNSPITTSDGTLVQVIKAMNEDGRQVGGTFQVMGSPTSTNLNLRNYNLGLLQGGRLRVVTFIYPLVESGLTSLGRVTVRKVGRPFFSFRGRRSNRR